MSKRTGRSLNIYRFNRSASAAARDREFARMLHTTQMKLDRIASGMILLRRSRATIGEPYNVARIGEVIVTLCYETPTLVRIDQLSTLVASLPLKVSPASTIFHRILDMGQRYRKQRAPVRHRTWKKGEAR